MIPSIRSLLISVHRTTAIFSIARALCFHQRLSLCLSAGTAVSACLLNTSRAAYLHACWLPFCLPACVVAWLLALSLPAYLPACAACSLSALLNAFLSVLCCLPIRLSAC